jgi:hypothetical protein
VQFDLTARYDTGRWRVSAAYYRYDISDLIERYQSGTDTFLFRNRGLAEIRGVEVEAGIELARGLAVDISGQIGRGRAADNDAALDDVGPSRAILQVRQALGVRVQVAARVAAIARDSSPGPSEVATPGYVDAGVTASWRTVRWLDLHLAAANLLNQRYYSSPSSRGVLAAGPVRHADDRREVLVFQHRNLELESRERLARTRIGVLERHALAVRELHRRPRIDHVHLFFGHRVTGDGRLGIGIRRGRGRNAFHFLHHAHVLVHEDVAVVDPLARVIGEA